MQIVKAEKMFFYSFLFYSAKSFSVLSLVEHIKV